MSRLSLVCPHCAREGKLPESVKTMPKTVRCPGCQKPFRPATTDGHEFNVVPEVTDQIRKSAKKAASVIGDGIKQTAKKAKDYAESDQAKALMEKTRRTAAEVGEKAKVTVSSMQGGGTRFLEKPILVGLSMIFCFPIGLFLVWRHSRWGKPVKWAWTGAFCGILMLLSIRGSQIRQEAKAALSEADAKWQAGDHAAAVAKYRSVLLMLDNDDKPLAYGRVIDHNVESGNTGEARLLLEEATRRGVFPSVNSAEGKALLARIESEMAEAKAQQIKRAEADQHANTKSNQASDAKPSRDSEKNSDEDFFHEYEISKGFGKGKIRLKVAKSLGVKFRDFKMESSGQLNYTLTWDGTTDIKKLGWASYDASEVRLRSSWLDFGHEIYKNAPTKGHMLLGFEEWKQTIEVRVGN